MDGAQSVEKGDVLWSKRTMSRMSRLKRFAISALVGCHRYLGAATVNPPIGIGRD